jgi:hypothetical protein
LTAQRAREERKGKRVFLCQFRLIEQRESRQLRNAQETRSARARAALFKKTYFESDNYHARSFVRSRT